MNVLALSRDEFNATVRELEAQGMDTAGLKRQYREASSPFSPLYEAANRNRAELAEEGRRPVLGGLFSKEPVVGVDTIRYEGFGPMMAGLLEPVARAVDAPYSAAQGLIPAEDMIGEAMGTAGVAMGAGGAVARPAGSVGMGGRRVFHGGKDFISDPQATVDPEGLLTGFSVTPSKSVAEMYSRLRDGDAVSEFLVDEDRLNAIDEMALYDLQDRLERERGLDEGDLSQDDLLAELSSRGINAVDYADPEFGLRVLDPSILKPVNGDQSVVSANASKPAGLLGTAASGRAPNKADLDPLGYQKTKMRGYLSDVDVNLTDTGENLPRSPMSWEDMEGKVVLPFYGDRTSRGLLVEGVSNQRFDQPVYTEGGVDFMRGPAAQADRSIWASNQNIVKRIESEADKAARNFEGRDIVGLTGSMAPDANDFATMTGAAMAELVKGAPITKAAAKEFDEVMRSIDPDFVGVTSPNLREWATSTSSPKRKAFIRLMDSNPMQQAGFPSPAEARYAVTDPTQRDMPAGMFGLGAARVDTSAPLMYNAPKGNLPRASVPHSTYNTQIAGDYLGSLPPVPQGLLFRDVYDAMEGKTTKTGQPLNEAHKTHAIKTKMPAQLVTPEVLDGILGYLSRQGR